MGRGQDIERRRRLVVRLLEKHEPVMVIVSATGYCPSTIREIARRYRALGDAALADGRSRSRGAPALLTEALQQELRRTLQSAPPDGRAWSGPLVAQWMAERTGRRIHRQRGWEYLRRLQSAAAPAAPEVLGPRCDDADDAQ